MKLFLLSAAVMILLPLSVDADFNPSVAPEIRLPANSVLDDSEVALRKTIEVENLQLLLAGDYAALEKRAEADQASPLMLADGAQPITYFWGLAWLSSPSSEGYEERLKLLKAWQAARPGSVWAACAIGLLYTNYAWYARGSKWADQVTDEGWKLFGERLAEAEAALLSVKDKRKSCQEWYLAMGIVGTGLSWPKDKYFQWIDEGIALHPKDPALIFAAVIYLLPRWMGQPGDVAAFIKKTADALPGEEGDILYARMAQRMTNMDYRVDITKDYGFSWPRISRGMNLICNRYPHSTCAANWYCFMAMNAYDKPAAIKIYNYLGPRVGAEFGKADWKDQERVWGNEQFLHNGVVWMGLDKPVPK